MRKPDIELPDEVAEFVEAHPQDVTEVVHRMERPWKAGDHQLPWSDAQRYAFRTRVRARLNQTLTVHEWAAMQRARAELLSRIDQAERGAA